MAVAWLAAEPAPVARQVTARLASATAGAAANRPANPRGRSSSPIAANATTRVPPMRALMAMIRIGFTRFCFHLGNAQLPRRYPAGPREGRYCERERWAPRDDGSAPRP